VAGKVRKGALRKASLRSKLSGVLRNSSRRGGRIEKNPKDEKPLSKERMAPVREQAHCGGPCTPGPDDGPEKN